MKPYLCPVEDQENITQLDAEVTRAEPDYCRMATCFLDSLELELGELDAERL